MASLARLSCKRVTGLELTRRALLARIHRGIMGRKRGRGGRPRVGGAAGNVRLTKRVESFYLLNRMVSNTNEIGWCATQHSIATSAHALWAHGRPR